MNKEKLEEILNKNLDYDRTKESILKSMQEAIELALSSQLGKVPNEDEVLELARKQWNNVGFTMDDNAKDTYFSGVKFGFQEALSSPSSDEEVAHYFYHLGGLDGVAMSLGAGKIEFKEKYKEFLLNTSSKVGKESKEDKIETVESLIKERENIDAKILAIDKMALVDYTLNELNKQP